MPKRRAGTKILVVDDDRGIRSTLTTLLSHHKYLVRSASCVEEGVALFREERADAAIVDYHLPDGTGVDLIMEMRALGNPAVVMMSGRPNAPKEAGRANADAYIKKPAGRGVVLDSLQFALARVHGGDGNDRWFHDDCLDRLRRHGGLTNRECDALAALSRLGTIEAVADELGVAYDTARNHVWRGKKKLGANSYADIVYSSIRRFGSER